MKPMCMFKYRMVFHGWLVEALSWRYPGCKPAVFAEKSLRRCLQAQKYKSSPISDKNVAFWIQ